MVRMIATFPDDSDTKESERTWTKIYLRKLIPHDSTNQNDVSQHMFCK